MTPWTDERLVALLTDTFSAHEADADPEVARRIAVTPSPAPRRWWPVVAAAAAVVLVAGITAFAVAGSDPAPKPSPSTPPATAPGHNRTLAAAEADRVLAAVPVPPGATTAESAPAPRLRHLTVSLGPIDPSLTRTAWWVVPLSYQDLVAWYDAHSPASVASAYTASSSSPEPTGDLYWQVAARVPSAYSPPAVVVSYARIDADTTAIRTDATLASRYDRTGDTLVPDTVTSIDITRTGSGSPVDVTVTDPSLVPRIVAAFNDLSGATYGTEGRACGSPTGDYRWYALTFHWPGHSLAVDAGQELCGVGRGLSLDGTELTAGLENISEFDLLLDEAVS